MLKIIKFYGTWCGPCKMLKPILERLQKEHNFVLEEIDIDGGIPEKYKEQQITSVPTLLLFWNDNFVEKITGFKPESELRAIINKYMEIK